jgi:RNA polymerase sigma-70 factor (ECF subfamily)
MLNQDQILSEHLLTGNKTVFSEVFSLHYRRLVMEAFYLLKEEQDAKDLVQEIFIDLWHKQDMADITSIKAYLTQAVRNRCFNALKATRLKEQKKMSYQYSLTTGNIHLKEADEADYGLLQQQRTDALQQAIQNLPPKTAEIFRLYYMERKSRTAVATEMGVSINTVKTVLSRTLQSLRKKTQASVTRLPD